MQKLTVVVARLGRLAVTIAVVLISVRSCNVPSSRSFDIFAPRIFQNRSRVGKTHVVCLWSLISTPMVLVLSNCRSASAVAVVVKVCSIAAKKFSRQVGRCQERGRARHPPSPLIRAPAPPPFLLYVRDSPASRFTFDKLMSIADRVDGGQSARAPWQSLRACSLPAKN